MLRNDEIRDDDSLSRGLRLCHRAALTLIALSTILLLVVLLKEKLADRLASSSRAIAIESTLTCSPIESVCPMVRPPR